ncbi:hypothetical protein LEMLEM_LOCUS6834 [Lemmus lemmus]
MDTEQSSLASAWIQSSHPQHHHGYRVVIPSITMDKEQSSHSITMDTEQSSPASPWIQSSHPQHHHG